MIPSSVAYMLDRIADDGQNAAAAVIIVLFARIQTMESLGDEYDELLARFEATLNRCPPDVKTHFIVTMIPSLVQRAAQIKRGLV